MPLQLTQAQVDKILKLKPHFLKAQEAAGVPWQAVAAIWMRESGSVAPPKTPGGPFQFDPAPPAAALKSLLRQFTKLSAAEIEQIAKKGVNDFAGSAILAACFLRTKTKPILSVNAPDEVILDALWGYNGKVQKSAWHSPYCVNGYDDAHMNMVIRGTLPDGKGGRKPVLDRNTGKPPLDKRPGTFTMYKQLKAFTQ